MTRSAPPARLAAVSDRLAAAVTWCESDPSPLRGQCRVLFEVHSSILNGGFEGLLDNPTGDLVPDAATAATALNARRSAEVLGAAMRIVGAPYPAELDAREAVLEALADEAWAELEALEDRWPQGEVPDAINAAIDADPAAFWSYPATLDEEAQLLLQYLTEITGDALFHPGEAAELALADVAAWVAEHGSEDQRRRVQSERHRLNALRR